MTTTPEISPTDPRHGYAVVSSAVRELLTSVTDEQLADPTPCAEFNVKDLMNHIVMVQQRGAAIGEGRHWSEVQDPGLQSGWAEAFLAASGDVHRAWTDDARLGAIVEAPWGELPGAGLLATYTAELAVHGWDLATAIDAPFTIPDDDLAIAHDAAMFLPAEGRDTPDFPFGEVVTPADDAPVLLKIAGWMGRAVNG